MTPPPAGQDPPPPPQAEAEWNVVAPRGRKGPGGGRAQNPGRSRDAQEPTGCRPASPAPAPQTPEELERALREVGVTHARVRDAWRASRAYESLAATVRAGRASHAAVARAVVLGNGPLHAPDSPWERRRTAHVQTAALLALVELLSEGEGEGGGGGGGGGGGQAAAPKVRCVFQEPSYSAVDRIFLERLGHTVVETPEAFSMVTPDTLVFGIHMYHHVYGQVLQGPAPAMFVGTSRAKWDELPDHEGHIKHSLRKLTEIDATYDKHDFPPDESSFSFGDTCIYWRKKDETRNPEKPPSDEPPAC